MGRRGSGLMMGEAPGLWALLPPSTHVDFISSMCQGSGRPSEESGCPSPHLGGRVDSSALVLVSCSPAHQLSPQSR